MIKNPLTVIEWSDIEKLNGEICEKARYQHGRTSDGYEPAKQLFEERKGQAKLDLPDVVDTMRELHKLAPFLFLNGNTFSEMGTRMSGWFSNKPLSALQRSAVGHHIAGVRVLDRKELKAIFKDRDLER
ncbi:hypothetical protein QT970_03445 [Microcoleus sp. herbarium8]|uniref:hypothetical protein n=1 Tax=Microcoleus sp. herbarium8 TaxID=3055436 RepID=UPI002FD7211D